MLGHQVVVIAFCALSHLTKQLTKQTLFCEGGKKQLKKTDKSHPRQKAVLKFLQQMEETKVDTEDAESAELQHFWKILLRGMEVKIPFSGKDKRDSESVDGVLHIFWLDGTTLYLRKEKVHFSSKSGTYKKANWVMLAIEKSQGVRCRPSDTCLPSAGMMSAMSRMGTISIPLAEMRDVSFGGEGIGGLLDDEEEEDDMNALPCLNKVHQCRLWYQYACTQLLFNNSLPSARACSCAVRENNSRQQDNGNRGTVDIFARMNGHLLHRGT